MSSQATSKGAPEETRDRAERGSALRGSDQRPSSPKRTPSPTPNRDAEETRARDSRYEKIINLPARHRVWITRLTWVVLFFAPARLAYGTKRLTRVY